MGKGTQSSITRHAGGRPKEDVIEKLGSRVSVQSVYLLIKKGFKNEEIAQVLGISLSTFKRWKKSNPQLLNLINQGKLEIADIVEQSLINRAIGFQFDEITREVMPVKVLRSRNGRKKREAVIENKFIITKIVTKMQYSDDAAKFLLTNYNPEKWKKDKGEADGDKPSIIVLHYTQNNKINQKNQILIPVQNDPKRITSGSSEG